MRVLTWNLFHGRSVPETPRGLLNEFARTLASWEWDVALLQEVPPWWPPLLGRACGASARGTLTSRNLFLPVRRAIAVRRPDLIKSGGGGANAILVRGERILEHRTRTLRLRPERRIVQGVRLERGWWVSNFHAQAHSEEQAQDDVANSAAATIEWAGGAPAILGGDANTRKPIAPGFASAGGHNVDHVLFRVLRVCAEARTLERAGLSDHAPVLVDLQ
jgi:endonuclease/exonuclease/phosphatase family metal-dependent hydrolase